VVFCDEECSTVVEKEYGCRLMEARSKYWIGLGQFVSQ
jgi:hypothetical protein